MAKFFKKNTKNNSVEWQLLKNNFFLEKKTLWLSSRGKSIYVFVHFFFYFD